MAFWLNLLALFSCIINITLGESPSHSESLLNILAYNSNSFQKILNIGLFDYFCWFLVTPSAALEIQLRETLQAMSACSKSELITSSLLGAMLMCCFCEYIGVKGVRGETHKICIFWGMGGPILIKKLAHCFILEYSKWWKKNKNFAF